MEDGGSDWMSRNWGTLDYWERKLTSKADFNEGLYFANAKFIVPMCTVYAFLLTQ
jgi:hypothetical protein